jgi:hypothetical protein
MFTLAQIFAASCGVLKLLCIGKLAAGLVRVVLQVVSCIMTVESPWGTLLPATSAAAQRGIATLLCGAVIVLCYLSWLGWAFYFIVCAVRQLHAKWNLGNNAADTAAASGNNKRPQPRPRISIVLQFA